jgi:hypothetical protein
MAAQVASKDFELSSGTIIDERIVATPATTAVMRPRAKPMMIAAAMGMFMVDLLVPRRSLLHHYITI